MKITLVFAAIFFTLHCSSIQKLNIENTDSFKKPTYQIKKIRYVGEKDGIVLSREKSANDLKDSECYFASIPGAFFGNPTSPMFSKYEIKNSQIDLNISLDTFNNKLLIDQFDPQKAYFSDKLKLHPKNTKAARVATLCKAYPSGFATESLDMLMLVYFDAPVSIVGSALIDKEQIEVNLQAPREGFYFIQRKVTGKGKTSHQLLAEPTPVYYVIFPPDALK